MNKINRAGPLSWNGYYEQSVNVLLRVNFDLWALLLRDVLVGTYSYRVSEMFADGLSLLKTTLVLTFIVGIGMQTVVAAPIVDLHEPHSLGTITTNQSGDLVYFSLGNGRALEFPVDQAENNSPALLGNLLFKKTDKIIKVRPVRRRNIKWKQ